MHGTVTRTYPMSYRDLLCLALAASLVCESAGPSVAQSLPSPFPGAPTTAAEAEAGFDARARAVIETNACGREDDYLTLRNEMAAGNFDHEGENLSHILLAKLAYIRKQQREMSNVPCGGQIFRPRAKNADGTPVHATYDDFEKADRLLRSAGPTACAEEAAQVKQAEPEGTVVFLRVSTACMARQVNEAIVAMRKTTQLGSSGLPCVATASVSSDGEFDVNVREWVRILYLGGANTGRREGSILAPSTIDYMYNELLAARDALSDDTYSMITGCKEPAGDELGSPEDTADRHAWYRELAKFLGDTFSWLVKTYVEYSLLTGVGGLAVMPFLLITDAADSLPGDVRFPETENHRLNIETSRYLINADIIARLDDEGYNGVDEVRKAQTGVRTWLLQRLQDIAARDFQEYNARPYTRYSLNAILNLHDFAAVHGDTVLAKAARIVLDLSEAKFAATSNRGRRIVPFRRRSNEDGDETRYLYESIQGADHEVSRAMLLSGQTQLLDQSLPHDIAMGALSEMVNSATSEYRLPPPVLATAIERHAFGQTVRHTGIEIVLQSPAFTISAGGIRTEPTASVSVLKLAFDTDRGDAMPTVIIPTIAGGYMRDLFRFDGVGKHHERTDNTCVAPGFACGITPRFSTVFSNCTPTPEAMTGQDLLFFASSAACFPASSGPHFYFAARVSLCATTFCGLGRQWGVMDIVEAAPPPATDPHHAAPDPAFDRFQVERRAALASATVDTNGNGTYVTAAGLRIDFTVAEKQPTVLKIDGAPPKTWKDAIDADGRGRATLNGPGGPVIIDFSDWSNPKRTP